MAGSKSYRVQGCDGLSGQLRVPGDKSISHRALMLGAIAQGPTRVQGLLMGEDVLATRNALGTCGAIIEAKDDGALLIHGASETARLHNPDRDLDLGNSGTGMRLMTGLLAGLGVSATLTGDESLRSRPMSRILEPLNAMGADIGGQNGRPPLVIRGGRTLNGIHYELPVASAQVKSCILLAGLHASGTTRVVEPIRTRDHTERMLQSFGCPIERVGDTWVLEGGAALSGCHLDVPGDFSSSAFFLVAGSLVPNSEIRLNHVGMNELRTGLLRILEAMGADISILDYRSVGGEPVADIEVRTSQLRGIDVPPDWVPDAIDEFPALFVAAALANGTTNITGAKELRVKESDRISVMVKALNQIGAHVEEHADGATIVGQPGLLGGTVDACHDHRCAMSLAVAGLCCSRDLVVESVDNVATSFPGFDKALAGLGADIDLTQVDGP